MLTSERIRRFMTTPWSEQRIDGPKEKYTLQLIEEMLWLADELDKLEASVKDLEDKLRKNDGA